MSYLSMMEARLPPGFRFHPRDEELVCDYLVNKIAGDINSMMTMMIDVDLNKCEPWDLPEMACVGGGKEWYFFSVRDRKYATGQRTNRATVSGYWKATGKDRVVTRGGVVVGMRKTLVFYQGRAPKGRKTEWVMHEFRLEYSYSNMPTSSSKEDWVLCRVFYKSRGLPSMATSSYEDTTTTTATSSSLPTLMEETYINFGRTSSMGFEGYEQVPCFSSSAAITGLMDTRSGPFKGQSQTELDSDKKVMRFKRDQLAIASMEDGSIDSYFSETGNGLSPLW